MRIKFATFPILAIVPALGGCMAADGSSAATASAMPVAMATLMSPDGQARGTATITETAAGLDVEISAQGLPAGVHAAHIHTTGSCVAPDFKSAGGHWNPEGHQHGANNPQGKHMGDMPNLTADASGMAKLSYTVPGGKLPSGTVP